MRRLIESERTKCVRGREGDYERRRWDAVRERERGYGWVRRYAREARASFIYMYSCVQDFRYTWDDIGKHIPTKIKCDHNIYLVL